MVDGVPKTVRHDTNHGRRCVPQFHDRSDDVLPTADGQGTELAAGLDVRGPVLDKGPGAHGSFSGFVLARPAASPGAGGLSQLAARLAAAGTKRVIVAGLAADVCVSATARDAARLGYPTAVALDATAFVHAHPAGDEAALAELRAAGIELRTQPVPRANNPR